VTEDILLNTNDPCWTNVVCWKDLKTEKINKTLSTCNDRQSLFHILPQGRLERCCSSSGACHGSAVVVICGEKIAEGNYEDSRTIISIGGGSQLNFENKPTIFLVVSFIVSAVCANPHKLVLFYRLQMEQYERHEDPTHTQPYSSRKLLTRLLGSTVYFFKLHTPFPISLFTLYLGRKYLNESNFFLPPTL
jgi:hypothetical protein